MDLNTFVKQVKHRYICLGPDGPNNTCSKSNTFNIIGLSLPGSYGNKKEKTKNRKIEKEKKKRAKKKGYNPGVWHSLLMGVIQLSGRLTILQPSIPYSGVFMCTTSMGIYQFFKWKSIIDIFFPVLDCGE